MLAALDQGTTTTRILVLDGSRLRLLHSVGHQQYYPNSGWVEHDPLELIKNIKTCLAAAGNVSSLAIANQGESCLAWDARTKEPLGPVIVWQDHRTNDVVAELKKQGAEDLTLARAGLPLDAYFSATKMKWMLDNLEGATQLLRQGNLRLGTTDAFFLHRLTGHCVTDVSTASRTSLMNLKTCQWDSELCALFGVPLEALPEIVPTVSDFGTIGKTAVRVSIVDQQAALYGHGCRQQGDSKITFGTGAFALSLSGSAPIADARQGVLPTVAWQKQGEAVTYALEGGVYNAGSAINWAQNLGLFTNYDEINFFERPPAMERGLAFVPALSGLGAPHWDRGATGMWLGLSLEHDRLDLMQAVLEGIALRSAQVIRAMGENISINAPVSIDGGLSKNPYFTQFLATACGQDICVSNQSELTALGALALLPENQQIPEVSSRVVKPATGDHSSWNERFQTAVQISKDWRRP